MPTVVPPREMTAGGVDLSYPWISYNLFSQLPGLPLVLGSEDGSQGLGPMNLDRGKKCIFIFTIFLLKFNIVFNYERSHPTQKDKQLRW